MPVTLNARAGDDTSLQVTLDLGPVVDAIGARLEALLIRSLAHMAPVPTHDDALDVPAAAVRLGISETGVWRLIRSNELESLKVGSRRVVLSSAIDAFLQRL